ncbi:MAG: CmcJ/NvfI family oxidoreductase [Pseudomonadota bacterium]
MPRTASVNYHVRKSERQAFEIDAGGVVGEMVSPELAPTEIQVSDERAGASVAFASDGVAFLHAPSRVASFAGEGWRETYDAELTALLKAELGVRKVVIFDHTVRIDDPDSDRKPARNVHGDYSPEGAETRLADILGEDLAAEWREGRYGFINVWRPVEAPINSAPLGFVRPASVPPEDWIEIDLIFPDRRGRIMGLAANPRHDWLYRSRMTPDEAAVFNIYDSGGLPSVAHSALDMVEDPDVTAVRKSIESRTLVRY